MFIPVLPTEILFCFEYICCFIAIFGLMRFFQASGLFVYIALAVVIANIQVLKTVNVAFFKFPVPLGTIVFSSTFLAVDILTEFYGAASAQKGVWLGFIASLLIVVMMLITINIPPSDPASSTHQAITTIFAPTPSLFAASLISYLICQQTEIKIFQLIRVITDGKRLWLRTFLSSAVSSLLDNIIFSCLAWIIFAKQPVSIEQLIYTYILGSYWFRIIIALLQAPLIYFMKTIKLHDSI